MDDKLERVVKREGGNLLVLNEDEYCCVCKSTDWDSLTWFGIGHGLDDPHLLKFCCCKSCYPERFKTYLAGEFEKALSSRPDQWRKNLNGTWSEIKKGETPGITDI